MSFPVLFVFESLSTSEKFFFAFSNSIVRGFRIFAVSKGATIIS